MAKHWNYFMFILWISYLTVAGIILFTRGFLLRRDAFTNSSTCIPFKSIPCTAEGSVSTNVTNGHEYHCTKEQKLTQLLRDTNTASKLCRPKKAKVILLIIDALRYDFAKFDPTLQNPTTFQNKLTIINDLLINSKNAKLYKFIADPPTTTMQRLKALTTGGLPTFIDAGSNFASPEINEDNIIDQLVKQNEAVIFLGDDTWTNLYPKRFTRSWPFPSFNVFDLDTVDYGIMDHLYNEISKDDWTLLIAHFLGVDHCGHRYGADHSEMERKLTEMNEVIKKVVNAMDNNTVLYVMGDHGMTNTGDHGGESDLEVSAALFTYSSFPSVSYESEEVLDTIKQIDIVPTLSASLGIPIPYSNLGAIILDSFIIGNEKDNYFTNWQQALLAIWENVEQITNYINSYSEISNQLNGEKLQLIKMKYAVLNAKVNNINQELQFIRFAKEAKEYLKLVRETCEDAWIHFDSSSISRGLLITFLTIFFVYLVTIGIPTKKLSEILLSSFVLCSYIMMAFAASLSFIFYYFSIVENLELTLYFLTGMVSIIMLVLIVVQNWEIIAIHWYECTKIRHWLDIACRLILFLFLSTTFSNSYILEEAKVLSYLILGLIFCIFYNTVLQTSKKSHLNNLKPKWTLTKTKLFIFIVFTGILLRISILFWRCREEQKWCFNYTEKNTDKIQCIIALISLAFFATTSRIWLRSCGNLVGFSPSVTMARYAPTVIVVCSTGFWFLQRLPEEQKRKLATELQINILAWTVYSLILLGLITIIAQPLCIYILPKQNESVAVYGQENIIPQIFNHVKELCYSKKKNTISNFREMPIVYGLGTVYSAAYIIISILLCLLIALLLGDEYAPASIVMYYTATVVLAIVTIAHYEKSTNIVQLLDVPNSSILCWVLLSHYFFYGTGHQPTFSLIHWKAAFVGTGGNFNYNFIPATLIGINTFGSQILMGFTLPLLLIAPFTLYIMFPNLASNKDIKDLKQGELILYEHNDLLQRGMFCLACKYILFHAIKMFACMLAVTIHCRHLMVWSIFAPKLIFEGIAIMVTLASVLISYLFFNYINNKVDKLIIGLEKQQR